MFQCTAISSSLAGVWDCPCCWRCGYSCSSLSFSFNFTIKDTSWKRTTLMALPAKSWPWASDYWITWVDMISPHFQGHWESLGIAQFIKLTNASVTLDLDLLSIALRVWYKGLNSFILPFGLTSITLRDISIFTRLPVESLEVVCLLDVHDPLLPHLEVSSTS